LIKYLGSKRTLLPQILDAIRSVCPPPATVLDVFSGTSRVGHSLKAAGYRVIANDHNAYAATLARCYVQADLPDIGADARTLIDEFNTLPGRPGYFTQTFCIESRFFQPRNGERIDAIRTAIASKGLEPELEAVLLTSLLEAADRVDSTTGLQMAYLKQWAPRAHHDLRLRLPEVLPRATGGKGAAMQFDAFDAARIHADIAYIDPPYNQHSYLGNYHIWETLVRDDAPAPYGIARKRSDVRERRSAFNSRRSAPEALRTLLGALSAPACVLSFSDEGFLTRGVIEGMLADYAGPGGSIRAVEVDYKRYVGAQIGIHNPRGERVGVVGHLRNTEVLYVVRADRAAATTPPPHRYHPAHACGPHLASP